MSRLNSRIRFFLRLSSAGFLAVCLLNSARAEVVFDNTQTDQATFWPSTSEYGDEIQLAGSARVITAIHMEYYGDFEPPTGTEKVRVRLYAKDGPPIHFPDLDITSPGTLLYESEKQAIYPGYNVLTLNQLSVPVSNVVIWTVQFEGCAGTYPGMGYSNRAGLMFYHPPVVGQSYDDFWMNKPEEGWMVYNFPSNIKANYGIRLEAGPEPPLEILSNTALAEGGRELVLNGPGFRTAELQCSPDETNWTTLRFIPFLGQPVTYVDRGAPQEEPRYYRLNLPTNDVLSLVAVGFNPYREFQLKLLGAPSRRFFFEGSADFQHWSVLRTNDFKSMVYQYADWQLAAYPQMKIYRATLLPDAPTFIGNMARTTNGYYQLFLFGPPGRQCVIEAAEDMAHWHPVGTNAFSYNGGVLSFVDFQSEVMTNRYYRGRLP
jgi:hypothetical protein